MKKIYMFYLYGKKDEINSDNYPGISGLDIVKGTNFYHVFYAWTHNKDIRKKFKQQRDMEIFKEIVHEIDKEDFDKFSDEYSDTFLEERAITTKKINSNGIIKQTIFYILTTKQELDYMVENTQLITGSQLENALLDDIYLRSSYFSEVYRKALCLFKFDELMSYACPLEDYSIPFNALTEDKLSIYSHLYHNTYRKELSEL